MGMGLIQKVNVLSIFLRAVFTRFDKAIASKLAVSILATQFLSEM